MDILEKTVLRIAVQMGFRIESNRPDSIILGFAKLLLMDESSVKNLLSESELKELEGARKVMNDYKLDLKLIKSGLSMLHPIIMADEQSRIKTESFIMWLSAGNGQYLAEEIVKKAIESACIPVSELFVTGKTMIDVFGYMDAHSPGKNGNKSAPSSKLVPVSTEGKPENAENAGGADTPDEPDRSNKPDDVDEQAETDNPLGVSKTGFDEFDEYYDIWESGPLGSDSDDSTRERTLEQLTNVYINLGSALLEKVKGQERAVRRFLEGCFQGDVFRKSEKGNHPRSYFFFFGPPGTGKTLLAETAADVLHLPCRKFDMSEFSAAASIDELIGTSPIYKNTREGVLTGFVKDNPECILIFDEIEKAHISVIRIFLQILGSGTLRSKCSEELISFRDAIIIFTSNVGKELYDDRSANLSSLPEKVLIDAIEKEKNSDGEPVLPLEICSRIAAGNTVIFDHLSVRHLAEMINENFDQVVINADKEYGCRVTYSNELPLLFLYNRGDEIDARVAYSKSSAFLKSEIYELIRQIQNKDVSRINAIHFDIDFDEMDPELKHLFFNESKTEILVLGDTRLKDAFESNSDKYTIHYAANLEEARDLLRYDLSAMFIDPFYGKKGNNESTLSITDYNTEGVRTFNELSDAMLGLPIYLVDVNGEISEVDRKTFLQEGAADTIDVDFDYTESFRRQVIQIVEEMYMEKQNQTFCQRGWVIDYKTRQVVNDNGRIDIIFYDLRKRLAVDLDSRDTLLDATERPDVNFDDIIGAENAKDELKYFISYLKNPKEFLISGNKPPQGVLLYGPPGTGKTMLAKAMAGESDVSFIQCAASDFASKHLGESEENIRKVFKRARKYAPAVIFIDEIDAIGKQRTGEYPNREAMLNTLLTQMQGFDSGDRTKPVFVLAATNYGAGNETDGIGKLDEALIRRFDNKIYVDLPNEAERKQFILKQAKDRNVEISDEIMQNIAERTMGTSLAILQNIFDLAFRNAVKQGRKMSDNDLIKAIEDYNYGEQKTFGDDYYKEVAIHEVGHAVVSYLGGKAPAYITIESRGDFGGYMSPEGNENSTGSTREDLIARIRTCLAGRAAEQVFFGKEHANNTGASSDLRMATDVAFKILCTYGMEEEQLIVLDKDTVMKSSVASEYIAKVNSILNCEMNNTIKMIEENRDQIEAIANRLVKDNRMTGAEFKKLIEEGTC